jgi:DNA-binding SARP family transcriptional activator/TolB-like protein
MIELRCLGALELHDPQDRREFRSVLAQPKRVALLVYLVLGRPHGFHSRERLFAMFWPESSQPRARKALDQAVYVLRQGLGARVVDRREDGSVRINLQRLSCDALQFEEMLQQGRQKDAVELYRGDLLDGFHVDGCGDFERWLDAERRRLRTQVRDATTSLADADLQRGNLVGALRWQRKAAEWAPYDEELLRKRLELLDRLGDRAGAIRAYERFETGLLTDLELEPSEETRALIERIRAEPARSVSEEWSVDQPDENVERAADLPVPTFPAESRRRSRHRILVGGVAALTGAVGLFAGLLWPGGNASEAGVERTEWSGHRVLVSPLRNETDDPSLDALGRLAADWIGQELATTGVVSVVPWASALRDAPVPAITDSASEEREFWLKLASVAQARYLVAGAYRQVRDSLRFDVQVLDTDSGELVRAINGITGPVSEPAVTLEDVRRRTAAALATAVDPRLASWERVVHPPPSLEAYRLFSSGMDLFLGWMRSGNPAQTMSEATDYFHRAAALDSSFIAPLIWAYYGHHYAGEWPQRDSVVKVVAARRLQLTPFERAVVDGQLAATRGDWSGQFDAYAHAVAIVPTSEWRYRLAEAAYGLRRYREAARILSNLDPDFGWLSRWEGYWITLTRARHLAGDHEAELMDAERYRSLYPESGVAMRAKVRVMAALGRTDEALQLASQLRDANSKWHTALVSWTVGELRAHGQSLAAEELLGSWLAWYDSLPGDERSRIWGTSLLLLAGRLDELQARSEEELSTPLSAGQRLSVLSVLGIVAARRGDEDGAREYMAEIDRQADPAFRGGSLLLRAEIAAQLDERDRAISLLQAAYQEGFQYDIALHTNPLLDPIRDERAFQEMLQGR